jgi:tRNA-2-methylthio-N6-dimethylallyladenosine synthase
MNRQHSAREYLELVARIRAQRCDLALSSDFIVGFPGETDRDFDATLALMREVGYAAAYSFKYSPRPGTPAAAAAGQIPEDVKSERLQILQALLLEQQTIFNRACAGRDMKVLFDRPGRKPGQVLGRSVWLQPVHVENAVHLIGQIHNVHILSASSNSLKGSLLREAARPPAAMALP